MSDKTPVDGEFGLDYQIFVMRQMIAQLPQDISNPLNGQLDSIVEAIKGRFKIVRENINDGLDDARMAVQALEFDLHATRNERDYFKNLLDDSL